MLRSMISIASARSRFEHVPGYLNAATLGLPTREVAESVTMAIDDWRLGKADTAVFDQAVSESRRLYASLVGVPVNQVAVGSQVSAFAGMIASALPDGAQVVCVEGDFASVVFPFLVHADRGVTVRRVPIERLADELAPSTDLVVFSLAMSASGSVVDADAVIEAARRVGATTLCNLTQAAGWMPVDASRFDITVAAAYKWLCAPRGSAFLTINPDTARWVRPTSAGWYAGADIWASLYGDMRLAHDARRFDVSPAWLSWVGTVPALRLFAGLDMAEVRDHDASLADHLRDALGEPPEGRAVVSLPDPDDRLMARMQEAGVIAAARAGNVRIAFHIWNDVDDVQLALKAIW